MNDKIEPVIIDYNKESYRNNDAINFYKNLIVIFTSLKLFIQKEKNKWIKNEINNNLFNKLQQKYKEITNSDLNKNEFYKICYKFWINNIIEHIWLSNDEFLKLKVNNENLTINEYFFENNWIPSKENLLTLWNNNNKSSWKNWNMFAIK